MHGTLHGRHFLAMLFSLEDIIKTNLIIIIIMICDYSEIEIV